MITTEQVEQKNIQLQKELALVSNDIISRFPLSDYLVNYYTYSEHES